MHSRGSPDRVLITATVTFCDVRCIDATIVSRATVMGLPVLLLLLTRKRLQSVTATATVRQLVRVAFVFLGVVILITIVLLGIIVFFVVAIGVIHVGALINLERRLWRATTIHVSGNRRMVEIGVDRRCRGRCGHGTAPVGSDSSHPRRCCVGSCCLCRGPLALVLVLPDSARVVAPAVADDGARRRRNLEGGRRGGCNTRHSRRSRRHHHAVAVKGSVMLLLLLLFLLLLLLLLLLSRRPRRRGKGRMAMAAVA